MTEITLVDDLTYVMFLSDVMGGVDEVHGLKVSLSLICLGAQEILKV